MATAKILKSPDPQTIRPSKAPAWLLTKSQKEELEDVFSGLFVIVAAAQESDSGFASVVVELLNHRSDVLDQLDMLPVGEEVVRVALESQEIPKMLRERFAEELREKEEDQEEEGGAE